MGLPTGRESYDDGVPIFCRGGYVLPGRTGEPFTQALCNRWPDVQNRKVREMRTAKTNSQHHSRVISKLVTGELRDTETVMRSSEGSRWKSASGNSLTAYLTSCPIL